MKKQKNSPDKTEITETLFSKELRSLSAAPFGTQCGTAVSEHEWAASLNQIIEKGKMEIEGLRKQNRKLKKQVEASEKAKGQIRESMGELLNVQKLSEAISSSRRIQEVLAALEQLSASVVSINHSGVYLLDEHHRTLLPLRKDTDPHGDDAVIEEQFEEGIIDWVIRERRPSVIPDIRSITAGEKNEAESNFIIIPLMVRGKVSGIYHINSSTMSNDLTSQDLELLSLLANQAAVAIENSRLYERMNRTIHEQTFLYEAGKKIGAVLDPNELFALILQEVCTEFNASTGWYYRMEDARHLTRCTQTGSIALPEKLKKENPFFESAQKKETVLYSRRELIKYAALFSDKSLRQLLCVPLIHHDETMGVIGVGILKKEPSLTHNHLQLLRTLSAHLVTAIENSRLYQDLLQANRHLTNMQSQLVHSGKLAAIGQLAGGVAHEINNPLQIILGRVQMVLMEMEDSPVKNELTTIQQETKRIASIVKNLLKFSRQDKREKPFEPTDMNQVMREALLLVRHQFEVAEVHIKEDLAKSIPAVNGDAGTLKQVFLNILINAKQAMNKNGRLTVISECDGRNVFMRVRDTGEGIPPEIIDKIFEPFFSTKDKTGGTGLGLSLSYGIIEKHGGTINVKSKVGEGTEFSIKLPVPKKGKP